MQQNFNRALALAIFLCISVPAYSLELSPNTIGGGNIPNADGNVNFYTSDGNWTETLWLPSTAREGDVINISSSATYSSKLMTKNTNIPTKSITLYTGDRVRFRYSAGTGLWLADATTSTPPYNGGSTVIPSPREKISRFYIQDGLWSSEITLPYGASGDSIQLISSSAQYDAKISTRNVATNNIPVLRTGNTFAFKYNSAMQKWEFLGSAVSFGSPRLY
ncbi:hypothetical protein [Paraburkholderia sp. J63]|uniref:hypothetical protein n=1 Tax=Paraburkholderia sp. J63 TaxID=2805434 RepID=UPI0039F610A7